MKLHNIHLRTNLIFEGVLSLLSISEDKQGPWWSQELSDSILTKPEFKRWLESLGITGNISRPMSGAVGRAYQVGDNHIVKFTTDKNEANAAAVLKGHDSEHAASVYDVRRVASLDDNGKIPRPGFPAYRHLYAIAMEKLNTGVGKRIRAAGNAAYCYLDDNAGFIEDPEAAVKVIIAHYLDHRSRKDPEMPAVVTKVVNALYDVQQKTGVLSQDPHGGNMALKGRKPAFFDFGRSSTNFDHPKAAGARITSLG